MERQPLKLLGLMPLPGTIPANPLGDKAGIMEGPLLFIFFSEEVILSSLLFFINEPS